MRSRAPAEPKGSKLLVWAWVLFALWQGAAALAVLWRSSASAGLAERHQALALGPAERFEHGVGELVPLVAAVREHVPPGASIAVCVRPARDGTALALHELEGLVWQRLVALLVPHPLLMLVLDERGVEPALTVPADITPFVDGGLHVLEFQSEGPFPGRDGARLITAGDAFRLWFAPELVEDP